jgi:hypothetical protein
LEKQGYCLVEKFLEGSNRPQNLSSDHFLMRMELVGETTALQSVIFSETIFYN